MATTLSQTQLNGSSTSSFASSLQGSAYATSPPSPTPTSSSTKGGGILANAHEAPKKPIKPADGGFKSAVKNAFIVPTPGKQMKHTGKPLGKSFRREAPLETHGHEGGEVLKRDPRGQNAQVGDGIVLSSESDDEEDGQISEEISSASSSAGDSSAPETSWTGEHYGRGRAGTASTTEMTRSVSRSSQASSNNPCKIKFCPLPSSGRLKRANSITIGVAARSHLLQSQGSARTTDNTASWQAQANAQRNQSQNTSNQQGAEKTPQPQSASQNGIVRKDDTVDLGEELRKGMLKAFRKIRRGSSVSDGSANSDGKGNVKNSVEPLEEEEDLYEVAGDKTPKRSGSPLHMSSHLKDDLDEAEGTKTPRHDLHRRTSTGAFTGNNSFMTIEERRKRGSIGETDVNSEEVAHFAEQLGQTHAGRVAHHMKEDKWHYPNKANGEEFASSTSSINDEFNDAVEDPEAMEAEKMADEALKKHSAKATHAGAVERMERRH